MRFFFILFFVALIVKSIKRNGLMSTYTFFLLFSMFFMFSRFIFDIFGYADVLKITFPANHSVKAESGIAVIFLCFLVYTLIDIGFFGSRIIILKEKEISVSSNVYKSLLAILLITLPLIIYKNYLRFKYVQSVGYIEYTLNPDDIKFPFFLSGIGWIFNVSFWALIICSGKKHDTKFLWCLYLIVSLLDSLKGNRAAFSINFVIAVYFLIKKSKMSVKKTVKILSIVLILFISFYLVATNLREANSDKNGFKFNFFQDILISLFYSQSVSLNIPLLYMDFFNSTLRDSSVPFVFADYLNFCLNVDVFDTGVLLQKLLPAPKGFGLGYSFLVEIFDLKIFAIPFCMFIGSFIKFVEKNFFRNDYFVGFFCLFFMSIIYMPRHIFFDFISPIRISWILCGMFLIFMFCDLFRRNKFLQNGEKIKC